MFAAQRHQNTLSIMQTRAPAAQPTWVQQWDELKTEWAAGTPTEAIAENLGRSISAVLTQAARLGLPRRQPQGRKLREVVEAAGVPRQYMRLTVASVNNSTQFHLMLAVDIPGRGTYFMDSNRENVLSVREARQLYTLWFMENPIARRMELVG